MSNTKPGLWEMILSVLASAFGVQSQKNYERDFNKGRLVSYIVIGVIFVLILIIGLITLVQLILS